MEPCADTEVAAMKRHRVRQMKAQLIVDIDRKLGQETPEHIRRIAAGLEDPQPQPCERR
jgi:hypothetical protein